MLAFISFSNKVITILNIMGDVFFKTAIFKKVILCKNHYFLFSLKEIITKMHGILYQIYLVGICVLRNEKTFFE